MRASCTGRGLRSSKPDCGDGEARRILVQFSVVAGALFRLSHAPIWQISLLSADGVILAADIDSAFAPLHPCAKAVASVSVPHIALPTHAKKLDESLPIQPGMDFANVLATCDLRLATQWRRLKGGGIWQPLSGSLC